MRKSGKGRKKRRGEMGNGEKWKEGRAKGRKMKVRKIEKSIRKRERK